MEVTAEGKFMLVIRLLDRRSHHLVSMFSDPDVVKTGRNSLYESVLSGSDPRVIANPHNALNRSFMS